MPLDQPVDEDLQAPRGGPPLLAGRPQHDPGHRAGQDLGAAVVVLAAEVDQPAVVDRDDLVGVHPIHQVEQGPHDECVHGAVVAGVGLPRGVGVPAQPAVGEPDRTGRDRSRLEVDT